MNYWIITDTHFGHEKMYEYCDRPVGFEEKILRSMSVVGVYDIVIHLGDVCIGNDDDWHRRFKLSITGAKRWLIRGNHDRKSNSWYHDRGWDFVGDRIDLSVFGKKIILTHAPVFEEGEYTNIHGHFHNKPGRPQEGEPYDERNKLFYIEHDYKPIKLRNLVE